MNFLGTPLEARDAYRAYHNFYSELEALERLDAYPSYLVDTCVDHENTIEGTDYETGRPIEDGSRAYWELMLRQAIDAAAYRFSDAGLDINDVLGRVVF